MDDVLWVRRPWNLLCVVINDDVVSVRSGRMCCRLICPSRPPNVSLGRSRFFCFSCPVQKRLLPPWKPVKPSRNHYEKKSRQPARNTVNPKILLHSTEPQKKRAQFCWNQKKTTRTKEIRNIQKQTLQNLAGFTLHHRNIRTTDKKWKIDT